jgi:hypothetical protein
MKCVLDTAGMALLALGLAFAVSPSVAQPAANSQVEVAYVQPSNRALQPIYDRLKKRQVLEEVQQFLLPLRLPRKLTVKTDQCGAQQVQYVSQGPVTICYELVEQIEKIATKVDPAARPGVIAGAFVQAVLYQIAQAVLDMFDVPVWGRMSDAADRFSALVMLKFGEDLAARTIYGTSVFFEASRRTWTGSAFADVTSPEAQRYYNYLCIAYGGSPITFRYLVTADQGKTPILPHARAVRCPSEYRQVLKAFDMRIMPFVDADLLIKVRATPWLLPTDVQ